MGNIIRVEKNNNYVVMNRTALNDTKLSWKAKGIMAYMLSMPDDWVFYMDELITHATDGKDSFDSGFGELKKRGYISRKRHRGNDGKFSWETIVHEIPQPEKPVSGKPVVENPLVEEPVVDNPQLLSIDELNTDELSNEESNNDNNYHNNIDNNVSKYSDINIDSGSGENPFTFYQENFGLITPFIAKNIEDWSELITDELVIEAMKKALVNNKPFRYAEGVMKKWYRSNIKSLEDIEADEKSFERKNKSREEIKREIGRTSYRQ